MLEEAYEAVDAIDDGNVENLREELGDVLWYVANIATQCGLNLEDIIAQNVDKLLARYPDKYTGNIVGVLSTGIYRGKKVKFVLSGPHIAMYGVEDDKFIKFLNKEEKKAYGFDLKENLRAQPGERPCEDVELRDPADMSTRLPWD